MADRSKAPDSYGDKSESTQGGQYAGYDASSYSSYDYYGSQEGSQGNTSNPGGGGHSGGSYDYYGATNEGGYATQQQYADYYGQQSGGGSNGYGGSDRSYGSRSYGGGQQSRDYGSGGSRADTSSAGGSEGKTQSQDTIYITGLSKSVTEQKLIDHFGSIGIIKTDKKTQKPKVWLYKDKATGLPKGDATVTYDDPCSCDGAINWFDGKQFEGSTLKVERAEQKAPPPGGWGGGGGRGGRGGRGRGGGRGGGRDGGGREGDWMCSGGIAVTAAIQLNLMEQAEQVDRLLGAMAAGTEVVKDGVGIGRANAAIRILLGGLPATSVSNPNLGTLAPDTKEAAVAPGVVGAAPGQAIGHANAEIQTFHGGIHVTSVKRRSRAEDPEEVVAVMMAAAPTAGVAPEDTVLEGTTGAGMTGVIIGRMLVATAATGRI
ncbi:uncharacterized protein SPPG_09570, partial [Spizellomyces punctatus DAOM BR117]